MGRSTSDLGFAFKLAETRDLIEQSQRLLAYFRSAGEGYTNQVKRSRAAIAECCARYGLSLPNADVAQWRPRDDAADLRRQMAVRHVAEQEGRIAKQEKLLQRLSERGLPTRQAEDLLGEMLKMLDDMRDELSRFQAEGTRSR